MNRIESLYWLALLALLSCSVSSNRHDKILIPYPGPAPDLVSLPFFPGLVSSDSIEFGSAFSQDGHSFYFTRNENGKLKMYSIHHDGQTWSEPVVVGFTNPDHSYADPALAPDGSLYFISDQPRDEYDTLSDYDIWYVKPDHDGWSKPLNAGAVNSDSAEFYVSFSQNGNLYFSSSRQGGFGAEDIYVSRLVNGRYQTPENLGDKVNSRHSEYDPFISSEENLVIFTSSGRPDSHGGGDLYFSKLDSENAWTVAKNLGGKFNTTSREYCSYLTPDGLYFFYSSNGNINWIPSERLFEVISGSPPAKIK